jgi:hypothetical protein
MKRYVFYDRATGEILHTHHVANADNDFLDVDERDLEAMVERVVDTASTASLVADLETMSSRAAVHHVDAERGHLKTSRVRRSESRAERRKAAD